MRFDELFSPGIRKSNCVKVWHLKMHDYDVPLLISARCFQRSLKEATHKKGVDMCGLSLLRTMFVFYGLNLITGFDYGGYDKPIDVNLYMFCSSINSREGFISVIHLGQIPGIYNRQPVGDFCSRLHPTTRERKTIALIPERSLIGKGSYCDY